MARPKRGTYKTGCKTAPESDGKLYWPAEIDTHVLQWRYWPGQSHKKDRYFEVHIYPAVYALVTRLINFHAHYSAQRDDIQADCFRIALKALRLWDPTRKTATFSYCNISVKWHIWNLLKFYARRKHTEIQSTNSELSLDVQYEFEDNSDSVTQPTMIVENREDMHHHTWALQHELQVFVDTTYVTPPFATRPEIYARAKLVAQLLLTELYDIETRGKRKLGFRDVHLHCVQQKLWPGITVPEVNTVIHVLQRMLRKQRLHLAQPSPQQTDAQ